MRVARGTPGIELRAWFGVLAAPAAWATQHVMGYAVSEADCDAVGRQWGVSLTAWSAVAMGIALLVALAGLLVALAVMRSTASEAEPPEGRWHFLGVVGVTVSALLLCIILMSGIGSIVLDHCRQS